MIDESQLENLKERLESIERLLENFISRDAKLALKYAQDDPNTAASKAGIAIEGLLGLVYRKIAEEKGEKVSDKSLAIEELKAGIGKIGGEIPRTILKNIDLIQQYRNEGSHSRVETVKSGELGSVLSALLNVLVWYLEDIRKETLDFSEIGLRAKEKQYIDFVTMALADGVIGNSQREFLNTKFRELGLSNEKAKIIEDELFLKFGKPNYHESVIQSNVTQVEHTITNVNESLIFEDSIYKKSLSLEITKKIQILDRIDNNKFDFSNKDDFLILLKTLDLRSLESVYKNFKNKDILYENLNNEDEAIDGLTSINIIGLIDYIITKDDLLQKNLPISHIPGVEKVNSRLLLSRIKQSLILINKILIPRNT